MNSDVQNKSYIHFTSVEIYSMSLDALNPGRHLSADKKVCGSSGSQQGNGTCQCRINRNREAEFWMMSFMNNRSKENSTDSIGDV